VVMMNAYAEAPGWLTELAMSKPKTAQSDRMAGPSTRYGEKALLDETIKFSRSPEGSRNEELNKSAFSIGQLIAGGELDQVQAEAALYAAAISKGLTDKEIRATIKSGIEAGMREPRSATNGGLDSRNASLPETPAPGNMEEQHNKGFRFLSCHELCSKPKLIRWLIKGILDANSISCFFGPSSTMKSFLVTGAALCTSSKIDWHGIPVNQSGTVFYIAGEGFNGTPRRIKAWAIEHGVDLERIPFFVSDRPAQILDKKGLEDLILAIDSMIAENGNPVWIIIDTLNRNFGPGDENSTADMTRFISILDELRSRYHCAISIVHHTGHSETERARGASALRAALDWEYRLQKHSDGTICLTCTKAKDHAEPSPIYFKPKEITIDGWIDPENGEAMTSCVLCRVDGQATDLRPLKGAKKIALDALIGAGNGEPVHIEAWRDAAYSSGISVAPSSEAKKKAFQRAVSDLLANGYVETQNDYWWPKREAGQTGHCRDMSRYVPGQTGHTPIGVSRVPSDEVVI